LRSSPKTGLEENKFLMAGKAIQDNAVMLIELNKQKNFDSFPQRPALKDLLKRMNLPE